MSESSFNTDFSTPSYSKTNPYISKIISKKCLSSVDSTKKTFHISLSIDSSVHFLPGDSVGIFPQNPINEVETLLSLLGHHRKEFFEFYELFKNKNLQLITKKSIQYLLSFFSSEDLNVLQSGLNDETFLKSHDFVSLLSQFTVASPVDIEHFASLLAPMAPRFYSIASDNMTHSSQLHLLVATFSYMHHGREVQGLGSSFLCHHAKEEITPIPFYIHSGRNFKLPADDTPIIMIGPGTGVAPFKSFIENRFIRGCKKNWLFFGERNRNKDFYYQDLFEFYVKNDFLKLSLAFSRDQDHKVYVQHLLLDQQDEFYKWMEEGAILYICGDAKNMAKDVQSALCTIYQNKEKLSEEESQDKIKKLRQNHKIIFEVY